MKTLNQILNEKCWKGYKQPEYQKLKPKKGKPGQFVPNCVPVKEHTVPVKENTVKEGKSLNKILGATVATGLAIGATGTTTALNHHEKEKARIQKIEKATKKALNDPFQGQMDGDYIDPHSSFANATRFPEDGNTARIRSVEPKHIDKGKIKSIDPKALYAMKSGFQSYKAGKFSINSGPPSKGLDPWYDGTKVNTSVNKIKGKK